MRFLLISDTHIGNPRPGYHHQEPLAEPEPLFQALAKFIRENKVEFICHAGDIIDDGSREQMRLAAGLFGLLPCPVYAVPGNHDLMFPESAQWFPEELPAMFPEGTTDYFLIRNGVRFDFLTSNWDDRSAFWDGVHLDSNFQKKQLDVLNSGPQDLPRIMITHSPVCGVPKEQTGFPSVYHAPPEPFEKAVFALAKEMKLPLILGGHNHLNLCVTKDGISAVTVPAFREMPFEVKLLEIKDGKLTMQTCSLADFSGIHLSYDYNKMHIQGRFCDRTLEIEGF